MNAAPKRHEWASMFEVGEVTSLREHSWLPKNRCTKPDQTGLDPQDQACLILIKCVEAYSSPEFLH
ncbi:hypothetical protein NIASO_05840 [Niabella soli DSM 19437]|uniref:Uncharacterized protein n=1 Tax=Niabella soli DSM 19437 TaxID=929713 RepID=W0F7K8_9BACT|nr:hypothetical protein NIASO_05840 [Niabella soli DSM 19437]